MSGNWSSSSRRSRLPSNWKTLRKQALERDGYRCRSIDSDGRRCSAKATDVDHIRRGDDHSLENLQSLCSPHHKDKTQFESWDALRKARARARWKAERKFGHEEEHPGKNPAEKFVHPWQ